MALGRVLAAAALLGAAACWHDAGPTGPEAGRVATVFFGVHAPASVRLLTVEVSGPGIDSTLVYNIALDANGVGSGALRVPAGGGRRILASAFDDVGVLTHRGDTTVTLVEGANPLLSLVLRPLDGSLPVVLSFGGSGIVISPGDTTIAVGDTVRYIGGGLDSLGLPIDPASIVWASTDPATAVVDASGLVRGVSPGAAYVLAVCAGAANGRRVTVQ